MKRIVIAIVAVLGMLAMSSVAEACHGKRGGCDGGCGRGRGGLFHHRQKSCSACGGHRGLFHRCNQQPDQPALECQLALVCRPAQPPQQLVYQTVAPPQVMTQPQAPAKSMPQAVVTPQASVKSVPQAVAPPPAKSAPQENVSPPPGARPGPR